GTRPGGTAADGARRGAAPARRRAVSAAARGSVQASPRRRALEIPLRILPGGAGQEDGETEGEPRTVQLHRLACCGAEDGRGGEDGALFLLDAGPGEDVLLLAGAEVRRLPRGAGGGELLDRARRGAAAWGREQLRMLHRLRLPERLIAYAERLAAAQTREAVLAALVEHTPRIAGGYCAVLLAPGADGALQPAEPEPHRLAPVSLPPHPRLERPCLISADEALSGTGGPFAPLAPLFRDLGARALAAVPFDGVSLLLLAERRTDRAFEPEDWELLRAAARQAEAALQRVRLFDEVRELSLTDPLTGLANRRQLRLVLERSLAAARRGESLTVAMLDLDDFKAVNEARGHIGGDRVLRGVADALAAEVRGSDLVARYGGDEFLVVLPGGNAASAASLLRRVRERLAGEVSVSAGIAEYGPDAATPDELIEAADRRLYAAKQQVHAGGPAADGPAREAPPVPIRNGGYLL
ncbi:MAG TPA: GGDEF domain-containing protein, partial [Longimicrobium sp.]|nr:GGDEF domain-containing protein [Longimicrobium sp.]